MLVAATAVNLNATPVRRSYLSPAAWHDNREQSQLVSTNVRLGAPAGAPGDRAGDWRHAASAGASGRHSADRTRLDLPAAGAGDPGCRIRLGRAVAPEDSSCCEGCSGASRERLVVGGEGAVSGGVSASMPLGHRRRVLQATRAHSSPARPGRQPQIATVSEVQLPACAAIAAALPVIALKGMGAHSQRE